MFIIESSKKDCLFLLILIGCIIGLKLSQISGIEFNLFGLLSQITIAEILIKNENENEINHESCLSAPQPQPQTQSAHETQHPANTTFNFDPTDARSSEFDDLEYIFDELSNEHGFNCDINTVLNIGVIKISMVIVIYIARQLVCQFLNFFLTDALNMHTVGYEIVLFLFFDIELAIVQEKEAVSQKIKKELYYSVNWSARNNILI